MSADEQEQAGGGFGGGDPFADFFRGRGGSGGFGGFDSSMFDQFETIFGGRRGGQAHSFRGQDIHLSADISFEEAVRGVKKNMTFVKVSVCATCKGSKCAPGSKPENCSSCAGKGFVHMRHGPMTLQMACNKCGGEGKTIKDHCKSCRGTGVGHHNQTEEVYFPQGINTGQSLKITGKVRD